MKFATDTRAAELAKAVKMPIIFASVQILVGIAEIRLGAYCRSFLHMCLSFQYVIVGLWLKYRRGFDT